MADTAAPLRTVRSFVRREGRLTDAQRRALATLWERFGVVPDDGFLDLDALFGRRAPRALEIGFGDGESLLALARNDPTTDYLGIDVHRPGVGRLLLRADALEITHLRVLCADAVEVVSRHLADACVRRILIFFPDPWPKARHHKRRLIQPAFVQSLARILEPGGLLHLATDWEDYARHMRAVLEASADFIDATDPDLGSDRADRPPTKFERRGRELGHGVWDLLYRRR